jgi:hypothetical protein
MLSKLNGTSALPPEAQNFLASYQRLLKQTTDAEATEVTIVLMYKAYYAEMGGGGAPPDMPSRKAEPAADNVTAFRRPAPKPTPTPGTAGPAPKPRLPVALVFICLVVVYVGIRYLWK